MQDQTSETGKIKARGSIISLCSRTQEDGGVEFTDWARLVKQQGIEPEVPDGAWHERVGILSWEAVNKLPEADRAFVLGRCGENICVTSGDLSNLRVGDQLQLGKAVLVVSELSKVCRNRCAQGLAMTEACAVSKEWIIATVVQSGQVCVDDALVVVSGKGEHTHE